MEPKAESVLASLFGSAGSGNQDPDSLVAKAKLFLDKDRVDLAEHLYRKALAANPRHFWANMGLARVCVLEERFEEAVRLYQQALDDAAGPTEAVYARTGLASAFTGVGQQALAEELLNDVIEEAPDYAYAYTGLVLLYETFPKPPWEKIVTLCEEAIRLAPAEALWVTPKLLNARTRVERAALAIADDDTAVDVGDEVVPQAGQTAEAAQLSVLFLRKKYAVVLQHHLRDQQLPYVLLLRQLFERVESVGPDYFTSLSNLFVFAGDFLAGDDEGANRRNIDLPLARRFYELAMEGKVVAPARAHIGLLKIYLRTGNYHGAETEVIRAVVEAGDNAEVLAIASRVTQAINRPGVARLLAARSLELAAAPVPVLPEQRDPHAIRSPEVQAWVDLERLHDVANDAKAPKFGTIEDWLETVAHALPANARLTPADAEDLDTLGVWLEELFALLGTHPVSRVLDLDYYRARSGTWFKDVDDALLHYLGKGWKTHLSPHPAIDVEHVRRQLRQHQIDSSSEPPLLLFLRHEVTLGLGPNILFEQARYVAGLAEKPEQPWFHYLEGGWQQNPDVSPFFDVARLRKRVRRNPKDALLPPLVYYFTRDTFADVNGLFHAGFYDSRYRGEVKDRAPLVHYLMEGAYLGFQPNPFFFPEGKTAQERIDYLKIHSAG